MKGLQVDQPYPSAEGIGRDERSVRIISPAYADRGSEMTAILQYVFQSIVLSGQGLKKYSETLLSISIAEMEHLEILGSLLFEMGALPVYTSCPPRMFDFYSTRAVSYACDPVKMILDDIRGEKEAIRTYEEMICKLANERVAAIIERIVLDEKLHLKTLETMYAELAAAGC